MTDEQAVLLLAANGISPEDTQRSLRRLLATLDETLIGPGVCLNERPPPTFGARGVRRFGWVAEWHLQQWLNRFGLDKERSR